MLSRSPFGLLVSPSALVLVLVTIKPCTPQLLVPPLLRRLLPQLLHPPAPLSLQLLFPLLQRPLLLPVLQRRSQLQSAAPNASLLPSPQPQLLQPSLLLRVPLLQLPMRLRARSRNSRPLLPPLRRPKPKPPLPLPANEGEPVLLFACDSSLGVTRGSSCVTHRSHSVKQSSMQSSAKIPSLRRA